MQLPSCWSRWQKSSHALSSLMRCLVKWSFLCNWFGLDLFMLHAFMDGQLRVNSAGDTKAPMLFYRPHLEELFYIWICKRTWVKPAFITAWVLHTPCVFHYQKNWHKIIKTQINIPWEISNENSDQIRKKKQLNFHQELTRQCITDRISINDLNELKPHTSVFLPFLHLLKTQHHPPLQISTTLLQIQPLNLPMSTTIYQ